MGITIDAKTDATTALQPIPSALVALDVLIGTQLQQAETPWLHELREQSHTSLTVAGLPGKRWESWHYSNADYWLEQFDERHGLAPIAADSSATAPTGFKAATTLIFSHGVLVAQRVADADGDALTLLPLDQLDTSAHAAIIDWLRTRPHTDSLAHLATALAPHSYVLIVRAGQTLTHPIALHHVTSHTGAQIAQLLVWVEDNAQATLLETIAGTEGAVAMQLGHTQLHLARGAKLTYARLHAEPADAQHLGVIEADVGRDAHLRMQLLRGGVSTVRNQRQRNGVYVRLQDNGAEFTARCAFAAAGSQHIDYHFTVDHNADHGRSDVQVQGIAGDDSRGIVNGRIFIAKNTRANDGHFTTHNLLLSDRAEINAKPELEIYADEVRCDHGATVGQLDEDQLLYLRTRGIDYAQAVALLTEGFLKAGLLDTGNDALDDYLQQQLLLGLGGSAA